jgi:hypothetical protein
MSQIILSVLTLRSFHHTKISILGLLQDIFWLKSGYLKNIYAALKTCIKSLLAKIPTHSGISTILIKQGCDQVIQFIVHRFISQKFLN